MPVVTGEENSTPVVVDHGVFRDTLVARGAARIGRGGKLHPAIKWRRARQDGKSWDFIRFYCDCGGTANGAAANKATFYGASAATCNGLRKVQP